MGALVGDKRFMLIRLTCLSPLSLCILTYSVANNSFVIAECLVMTVIPLFLVLMTMWLQCVVHLSFADCTIC